MYFLAISLALLAIPALGTGDQCDLPPECLEEFNFFINPGHMFTNCTSDYLPHSWCGARLYDGSSLQVKAAQVGYERLRERGLHTSKTHVIKLRVYVTIEFYKCCCNLSETCDPKTHGEFVSLPHRLGRDLLLQTAYGALTRKIQTWIQFFTSGAAITSNLYFLYCIVFVKEIQSDSKLIIAAQSVCDLYSMSFSFIATSLNVDSNSLNVLGWILSLAFSHHAEFMNLISTPLAVLCLAAERWIMICTALATQRKWLTRKNYCIAAFLIPGIPMMYVMIAAVISLKVQTLNTPLEWASALKQLVEIDLIFGTAIDFG